MQPCIGCTPVTALSELPGRLGMGRRQIARLLSDRVLIRLHRHLVVGCCLYERAAENPRLRHRLRLEALLARFPDAIASHESAAVVHGLPVFHVPPVVTVTRPSGAWRGGQHERVRIARLPSDHVTCVDDLPVTTVARTLVDVSRTASLRAATVVGDAALRRGLPLGEVRRVLAECAAWADVGKARIAVDFFDPRAESPLESLSRVIFREYDVPAPRIQRTIRIAGKDYRVDFYWEFARLVGEADGREKYDGDDKRTPQEVVWQEKVREDALRDDDYKMSRWTYGQMLGDTAATVDRVLRKMNG